MQTRIGGTATTALLLMRGDTSQRRLLSVTALNRSRRRHSQNGGRSPSGYDTHTRNPGGAAAPSSSRAHDERDGDEDSHRRTAATDFSKMEIPKSYDGGYRVGAEIPMVSGEVGRLDEYLRYRPGGLKNLANKGSSLVQAAFGDEEYSRNPDSPLLDHGIDVAQRAGIADVELEHLEASMMVDGGTWKAFLEEGRRPQPRITPPTQQQHRPPATEDDGEEDGIDMSELMMDAVDDVAEDVSEATRVRHTAYKGVEVDLDEDGPEEDYEGVENGRVLPSVFGEVVVPSKATSYSFRGGSVTSGEHAYWSNKQLTAPAHANPSPNALASREVEQLLLDLTSKGSPLLLPNSADSRREEVQTLLGRVFEEKLSLQAKTVEGIFTLFSLISEQDKKWAAQTADQHNTSPAIGRLGPSNSSIYTPNDFLINRHIGLLSKLYYHQKSTFTSPTPMTVEMFMKAIHQNTLSKGASVLDDGMLGVARLGDGGGSGVKRMWWYNQAHLLLKDCDKYVVLPTRGTYSAYFGLCAHYGDMSTALRRFIDSQEKMGLSSNPAMVAAIVSGLVSNGHNEEALRLIGRCSSVRMSIDLFNSILEALLLSRDATACFTAYDAICLGGGKSSANGAIQGRPFTTYGIIPSAQTFSLLLLAMQKSGEWSGTTALLGQMQRAQIKGDATTLNLMLKGLLVNKLSSYANQLHRVMIKKGVSVWPDLDTALANASVPPLNPGTLPSKTVVVGSAPPTPIKTTSVPAAVAAVVDLDLSDKFAEFMTPVAVPTPEAEIVSTNTTTHLPTGSVSHEGDGEENQDGDDESRFVIDPWDIDESGEIDPLDMLDERALETTKGTPEDAARAELGEAAPLPHADYFDYEAGTTTGLVEEKPKKVKNKLTFRGKNGQAGRPDGLPPTRDPRYVRATTEARVRELIGGNKGGTIHPKDLLRYLDSKGIHLDESQRSNPSALRRKATKHILGINPFH